VRNRYFCTRDDGRILHGEPIRNTAMDRTATHKAATPAPARPLAGRSVIVTGSTGTALPVDGGWTAR